MSNIRLSQNEYDSFLSTLVCRKMEDEEIREIIGEWCVRYLLMTESKRRDFWLLFDEVMDVDDCFDMIESGVF